MSADGDWPADPSDPRCPECDGPVSATSPFCMHCEADLPPGDPGSGTDTDVTTSTNPDAATSSGTGDAWLDPDGLLDDVSTVGVGVVAGLLAGVIASATLLFALPDLWPFVAGLAVWAGATAWIARTRTVFGTVRKAGYLVGALLAVAPLLLVATAPFAADTLGQRLTGVPVFGIFAWPVGLVAAGVGWLAGHGRPDRDE